MRVAAQVQSEMSVILRRVFGLRLAAQHHLVHQLLAIAALHLREDVIERFRAQRAGLGERDLQSGEEFAQAR